MTSSIVLTNMINIEFTKDKFSYTDTGLDECYVFEKGEIPFVRYRFGHYGVDECKYIKENISKFTHSAHLAEIVLDEGIEAQIKAISELEEVAIFVYFNITKENITSKSFNESQKKMLSIVKANKFKIERIMMKDVDGMLHMLVAKPLVKNLASILGVKEDRIGYCSCAFSADGMCCLTALRARDIAARYSNNTKFAIATNAVEGKNIEHQNGCQCIRHIILTHEIDEVLGKSSVSKKKASKKEEKVVYGKEEEVNNQEVNWTGDVTAEELKRIQKWEKEFMNTPVAPTQSVSTFKNYKCDGQYKFTEDLSIVEEKAVVGKPRKQTPSTQKSAKNKLKMPKKAIKF